MYSFDRSAPLYRQTIRELNLGLYKGVISCPSSTSVAQGTIEESVRFSAFPARKQEHLVDSGDRQGRPHHDDFPAQRHFQAGHSGHRQLRAASRLVRVARSGLRVA